MQAKTVQQPQDPNLANEQAQAQQQQITQLQNQAQADTASFMARYGTRLALSGMTPAPATTGKV